MEIAESEFLDIRKARTQYEKSVEVRVLTKAPDIAVDAVSLRTFVEQDAIVSEIDRAISNSIGASEIYQPDSQWLERASKDAFAAGMQKLQDLRALLFTYQTAIPEYVGRMQKVWPAATKFSIPAGVCIFHLCMMLVFHRNGKDEGVKFLAAMHGIQPSCVSYPGKRKKNFSNRIASSAQAVFLKLR